MRSSRGSRWAVGLALAVTACAGSDADGSRRLNVYAASSLTEAFAELEADFEAAHPETDVVVTYAGSQVLRLQIEQGARADVFASANPEHMDALVEGGYVSGARVFAHNELVVIVPAANPAGIHSFADLAGAERLVIGTPNVPVGRYARAVVSRAAEVLGPAFEASVLGAVVSEEANVRLARAKVELGEADAAIVYVTDAADSDRIRTVPIPQELNVRAEYLIGVGEGPRKDLAERWVERVLAAEGRAVLARHGFLLP